jgi:hypothetical protein
MFNAFKQKAQSWTDSLMDAIKRSAQPGIKPEVKTAMELYQNPPEEFKQTVAQGASQVLPQKALVGLDKWNKLATSAEQEQSKWPISPMAIMGATVSPLRAANLGPSYFLNAKDTDFMRNVLHSRAMNRTPKLNEVDRIRNLFESVVPVNPETKAVRTIDEMLDALSAFLPRRDFIPRIRPVEQTTQNTSSWTKNLLGKFTGRSASK